MKLIITLVLVLTTSVFVNIAYAQSDSLLGILPIKDGEVYYRKTYTIAGVDKSEIFRRARRWWVLNYRSVNDVLQLADDKTGELIGKGYQDIVAPKEKRESDVKFTIYSVMSLDVKDEAYTITINQIQIINSIYASPVSPTVYKRTPERSKIRVFLGVDQAINETMTQINQFIKKGD